MGTITRLYHEGLSLRSDRKKLLCAHTLAFLCLSLFACAKSGGGSLFPPPSGGVGRPSLEMAMERVNTTDYSPFYVVLTARDGSAAGVKGLSPQVTSSKGTVSAVTDNGDGTYTCTVTPPGTNKSGEYIVTGTVSSLGISITRTALLIRSLHASLGQPMAVPGASVNTSGWEDSINVTPDGEWLLLMYSPISLSGVLLGDPSHDWAKKASGPWAAPERPGFPDGRIDAGGTVSHIFPLWCDYLEDTVVQPVTMYCFRRQADGTFGDPVMIGSIDSTFNNPMLEFGPHALMTGPGTTRIAYSFADPLLGTGRLKIYYADVSLGSPAILADYYKIDACPSVAFYKRNQQYQVVPLDEGDSLHLNDPHMTTDGNGAVKSLWLWKEETPGSELSRSMYVYTLKESRVFPGASDADWEKIRLPSPLNADGSVEMQPHFTGSHLYFYRNGAIVRSGFLGGAYGNSGSWGAVQNIIAAGGEAENVIGQINVVGEPTLCVYGGKTYLYFVYVVVTAYDAALPAGKRQKFDLNAGFVEIH